MSMTFDVRRWMFDVRCFPILSSFPVSLPIPKICARAVAQSRPIGTAGSGGCSPVALPPPPVPLPPPICRTIHWLLPKTFRSTASAPKPFKFPAKPRFSLQKPASFPVSAPIDKKCVGRRIAPRMGRRSDSHYRAASQSAAESFWRRWVATSNDCFGSGIQCAKFFWENSFTALSQLNGKSIAGNFR